jgi:hypothetical protein
MSPPRAQAWYSARAFFLLFHAVAPTKSWALCYRDFRFPRVETLAPLYANGNKFADHICDFEYLLPVAFVISAPFFVVFFLLFGC